MSPRTKKSRKRAFFWTDAVLVRAVKHCWQVPNLAFAWLPVEPPA